jgi:hypothetical protein
MNQLTSELRNALAAPQANEANQSLRAMSRRQLRDFLRVIEVRNKASESGIGILTTEEDRTIRAVLNIFRAAVTEVEAEKQNVPSISLADVDALTLRRLMSKSNLNQ